MRKVRWGNLTEIDRRIKVGSPSFSSQPKRLQQLMAWRAMHIVRSHATIRRYARRSGVKPSSDIALPRKVTYVTERI